MICLARGSREKFCAARQPRVDGQVDGIMVFVLIAVVACQRLNIVDETHFRWLEIIQAADLLAAPAGRGLDAPSPALKAGPFGVPSINEP